MIRAFHSIEVTSRCNLRCHYCPQPTMARAKQDMTRETFERALSWLMRWRQQEIHLHNFGESTLHPELVPWIAAAAAAVPRVYLSTNGVAVTRDLVKRMKWAGLTRLDISVHRPEKAQWAAHWCRETELPFTYASGALVGTHNWAGQVDAPVMLDQPFPCSFLADEKASVFSDGRIAACCIDAEGVSAGDVTVFDDLNAISFRPFSLCRTCHHTVPEAKFPGWREELERDPDRHALVIEAAV